LSDLRRPDQKGRGNGRAVIRHRPFSMRESRKKSILGLLNAHVKARVGIKNEALALEKTMPDQSVAQSEGNTVWGISTPPQRKKKLGWVPLQDRSSPSTETLPSRGGRKAESPFGPSAKKKKGSPFKAEGGSVIAGRLVFGWVASLISGPGKKRPPPFQGRLSGGGARGEKKGGNAGLKTLYI